MGRPKLHDSPAARVRAHRNKTRMAALNAKLERDARLHQTRMELDRQAETLTVLLQRSANCLGPAPAEAFLATREHFQAALRIILSSGLGTN